jgi:hypothetical protein
MLWGGWVRRVAPLQALPVLHHALAGESEPQRAQSLQVQPASRQPVAQQLAQER